MIKISKRWPLMLAGVAAVAGMAMGASSPAAQAAPSQQAMTCSWSNVGTSTLNAWNVASAVDTDKNQMVVYSGLDDKLDEVSKAEMVDFNGAAKPGDGKIKAISGAAPALYGVTGAYRAKGMDNDLSAIYWFGGSDDVSDGTGSNTITELKSKGGAWGRVSVEGDNLLQSRYWASSAYDPIHDVIWIVGGIGTCKLTDVVNSKPCSAKSLATLYMSFDGTGGAPKLNSLSGANKSVYGHEMVYDPDGKRMLIFGGTSDGNSGIDRLEALDLSDPDVTKAKFKSVTGVTGTTQKSFLPATAFWTTRKWMVTAGGLNQEIFLAEESANSKTIGLNLMDPTKAVWTDLKATANDRIGAAMEYVGSVDAVVMSSGRQELTQDIVNATGDPATNIRVTRSVQALTCTAAATAPATNTPGTNPPTNTPGGPTAEVPTRVPEPTLTNDPVICEAIKLRVPAGVINEAAASPDKVGGYGMACNPNLPASSFNPLRRYLGLRNPNNIFHPIFNGLVWKCSCP